MMRAIGLTREGRRLKAEDCDLHVESLFSGSGVKPPTSVNRAVKRQLPMTKGKIYNAGFNRLANKFVFFIECSFLELIRYFSLRTAPARLQSLSNLNCNGNDWQARQNIISRSC